jgi:hypothetical protein
MALGEEVLDSVALSHVSHYRHRAPSMERLRERGKIMRRVIQTLALRLSAIADDRNLVCRNASEPAA